MGDYTPQLGMHVITDLHLPVILKFSAFHRCEGWLIFVIMATCFQEDGIGAW